MDGPVRKKMERDNLSWDEKVKPPALPEKGRTAAPRSPDAEADADRMRNRAVV
jgi:hypothetical protein